MKPFIRKSSALPHSRISRLHGCARERRGGPANASESFDVAPLQLCMHFPQQALPGPIYANPCGFFFYLGVTDNISSNPWSRLIFFFLTSTPTWMILYGPASHQESAVVRVIFFYLLCVLTYQVCKRGRWESELVSELISQSECSICHNIKHQWKFPTLAE